MYSSLYAGIHLPNKPNEFITLQKVDMEKPVSHLKDIIAEKTKSEAHKLELIYNGLILKDDAVLNAVLKAEATVHCFHKTKQYVPYEPSPETLTPENIRKVQDLFNLIANIQISLNCRVNILQKVLAEYPEFRRNLAALILIRDSVLFNALHEPNVINLVAKNHPIIIEAAPFIVGTVKKELAKSSSNSEQATDSTNSSEEENSVNERSRDESSTTNRNQSDSARLRIISRQQLQAALAEIGFGSVNSLTNIAQRNTENSNAATETGVLPLTSSASDERLSTSMLRSQLQRAFDSFEQRSSTTSAQDSIAMDTLEQDSSINLPAGGADSSNPSNEDDGDIPLVYRTHQYSEQLRTMAQMGFLNHDENLNYLNLANGNIENAINLLMAAMS